MFDLVPTLTEAFFMSDSSLIPLWLKVAFTAFMAILVPVYWIQYGPTNFLYFCDIALFLTLVAIWTEDPVLVSAAAVGIVLPQLVWMVDFLGWFVGWRPLGSTDYMFDAELPLYLRALSFFHFWLPVLLVWMVYRLGYDIRGLYLWTGIALIVLPICYFFLPGPFDTVVSHKIPKNINYVFGFQENAAQTWMPAPAWLGVLMIGLPLAIYLPSHLVLSRTMQPAVKESALVRTLNRSEESRPHVTVNPSERLPEQGG